MKWKRWSQCFVLITCFLTFFQLNVSFAQKSVAGEISGVVRDQSSKELLPFATVMIKGTVTGIVTDLDGAFRLGNIQPGDYTLVISYIGYTAKEVQVTIKSGERKKLSIDLDQPLITVGEVVVSSQRRGQNAAINQQLKSNALVNVVSKDAIRELPDVNAAEAIGRLPGVSLVRSNGEGSKVVLRGLDPKFSNVTINGIQQPSTDVSTNGDRSVDLSNISPELLSGIEVFKSPTADMDADAIAGTINLVISKASDIPTNQFRLYGGYSNLYQTFGNYKASWDFSSRFLDKKLGIMAQVNYESRDRSAQSLDIAYFNPNAEKADSFYVDGITLTEKKQLTKRYGGLVLIDYQFDFGSIYMTNILNSSPRTSYTQSKNVNRNGLLVHNASVDENKTTSFNSTLGGVVNLSKVKLDWSLTRVQTTNFNPYDMNLTFNLGAPYGLNSSIVGTNVSDPKIFADNLTFNSVNQKKDTLSFLNASTWTPDTLKQTNYTAKLDFEIPLKLGDKIAGFFKFGGKYQTETRKRSGVLFSDQQYYLKPALTALAIKNDPRGTLAVTAGNTIQMSNFAEQTNVPILNDKYNMFPGILESQIRDWHTYHMSEYIEDPSNAELNYDTYETMAAGYAMLKLNYGDFITFIPGIRYEYSNNTYHGVYSSVNGAMGLSGYFEPDTTVQKYGEWLPSAHLKIKPTSWMDIRFSAARTLTRPNYMWLVPRFRYNAGNYSVSKANPDLKHATAWNYDASVTFYTGEFGLLSVGGYTKKIYNMFYGISGTLSPEDAVKNGLPPQSFDLNEDYTNLKDSYVRGIEFDYKTHFNFLPEPFNRFAFGVNFTRLWSSTYYMVWKKVEDIVMYNNVRPTLVVDFTKSYFQLTKSRMPSQVDFTANTFLGYDHKGFSTRVSMSYQGNRLTGINPNTDQLGYNRYTDKYVRFDVTAKQKINKYFSVLLNLNNLTNATEKGYRYTSAYPTYENMYGFSADFGVEINLQ
ncbi:MAG: TonB-dependent receptor [Mariniphaga sp.]